MILGDVVKAQFEALHGHAAVPAATAVSSLLGEGSVSPGMQDADCALAAAAIAGDRAAFEALLRRHYQRMHRVAWRLTGSASDAEDIAQDVCCLLVEKIGTFKGEAKFTTWLIGIVVNACRDHHRRRSAAARLGASLSLMASLTPPPDGRDLYQSAWLASALARLQPQLRDTVVLVVGEEMTHAEAAAALGVAETTVSWRMHRLRRLFTAPAKEGA